jgi:hypothetical protein
MGGKGAVGSEANPTASEAGRVGAMWRSFAPAQVTNRPPRWNRMNTGFRTTTAARRTSPAQGAIIAAETAAPRGCWPRDPRSGVGDKLR